MKKFYDLDIVTCAMTYNNITGWAYRYKDGYHADNVLHTGPYLPLNELMDELVTVDTFATLSRIPDLVAYVVKQGTGGATWNQRIATVGDDERLHPAQISFEDFLTDRSGTLIFVVQMFDQYTLAFKVGSK